MGVEKIRRPILGSLSEVQNSGLGWADYSDNVRVSFATGQLVAQDTWVAITNNGLNGPKLYEPTGISLFQAGTARGDVITGREGDGLLITTEFTIQRETGNGSYTLLSTYDIGGAVGDLYSRTSTLPGAGAQSVQFTTAVYTLDTWASNGALFEVQTSVATRVFNMRHVIHRTLPAPASA